VIVAVGACVVAFVRVSVFDLEPRKVTMALKELILGAADLPRKKFEAPEWDGVEVYQRVLSGAERDRVEKQFDARNKSGDWSGFRAWIAVMVLVDGDGAQVFDAKDAGALDKKNGVVLDRLVREMSVYNGFKKEAVEDAAKNSGPTPPAGSGSD
jgi:hypothetical protein